MELRYYLNLFRRYAWMLALALVLGGGAALLFSSLQTPVYEGVTWAIVVTPQRSGMAASSDVSTLELLETYVNMSTRRPVLEAVSREVGFEVTEDDVSATRVTGTRMIEVKARAPSAELAARMATALVNAMSTENELLQTAEYATTEAALEEQLAQVEAQIESLQAGISERVATEIGESTAEQEALLAEIEGLQTEVFALEQEVNALLAPQLSPEQQARLTAARAELSSAVLEHSLVRTVYDAQVAQGPGARDEATEEELLELEQRVLELEDEIEELTGIGPPADPEARQQLVEAQAALAQKQLDRQLAMTRYLQLSNKITETEQEEKDGGTAQERARLELYTQLHGSLVNSLESVRLARLQNTSFLSVVEEAEPPEFPVRPRPLLNTLLGGIVALMAAAGLILLLDYLDGSVRSPDEAVALTGLPVIGAIGQARRRRGVPALAVVEAPEGAQAEGFRTLRTNLEFAAAEQPLRTILVTSAEDEAGKTTVAANLAAAFAQGGQETLLVDADVRRPRLHALLNLGNERGLGDLLRGPAASVSKPDLQAVVGLPGLRVLPSGNLPPQPYELLGTERSAALLAELAEAAEVVVLDSPPLSVADAARLAPQVDGVLLVVRPGATEAEALAAAADQLERAGARMLGIVLNGVPRRAGFYPRAYTPAARGEQAAALRERQPAFGEGPAGD